MTLVVIVVVWLVGLSITSRKQPELEMVNGQLQPCPATPNCVCSEFPSKNFHVGPLGYSGTSDEAWSRLKRVISDTGGKVIAEKSDYLRAVYQTPLLRFVDDVEFRLNTDQAVIHVRSASRVGHSDLGANRQRVEKIRARFGELTD
ncbi:MAG: DUF1499 domain-containing protein [Thiohalophilus sp.]